MHALASFASASLFFITGLFGGHSIHMKDVADQPSAPHPTDTSGAALHIPIFIYHSITNRTDDTSKGAFSTKPELLDEQLTYLEKNGYTLVTMKEVADMLKRGTTTPYIKPVALTFDDGWETQYEEGLPILKKHHAKATFYVYTNALQGLDHRFMTWDQVKEVSDGGFEIADHSISHPLLSKLTPQMLHHELYDSKVTLEQKLGIKVTDFASPFGYSSPAVIEELKKDGYETGRTTVKGSLHTKDSALALTGYLVHRDMKDFEYALKYAN